jgi:dolichol-phosphate mannosyltransferase
VGRFVVSVVVPAYNEDSNLSELCKQITTALAKAKVTAYELLVVNDGSTDDTLPELQRLAKADRHINYISFSRNFGHQAALRAGLAHSHGDAVITMDADLQHPPQLLPELIERWRSGYDIVYTKRQDTADTSVWKRLSSYLFYKLSNFLMGIDLEYGTADFRLLDRRVVKVVNAIQERRLFMRAFIKWAGFRSVSIDYTPAPRFHGSSKYSFSKMQRMALDGITQFSIRPLRLVTLLGAITIGGAFLYAGYVAWVYFGAHRAVAGWSSLMIVVILLFGIQFLVLGIMGEYLGRTFLLAKDWPDYIIDESRSKTDDHAI